jgi:hypothetical protein
MQRCLNDLADQFLRLLGPFAAAGSVLFNAGNASLGESTSPQADRLRAAVKLPSNLLVAQSRRGQ